HTRSYGDWSSDVCSSDLGEDGSFWSRDWVRRASTSALVNWHVRDGASVSGGIEYEDERQRGKSEYSSTATGPLPDSIDVQRNNKIGRASCRERGEEQGGD